MRVGCGGHVRRVCLGGAAFAALLLAEPVHAQAPDLRGAAASDTAAAPAASAGKPAADATGSYQPDVVDALQTSRPGPSFQYRVTGDASESYVSNAYGGGGPQ